MCRVNRLVSSFDLSKWIRGPTRETLCILAFWRFGFSHDRAVLWMQDEQRETLG